MVLFTVKTLIHSEMQARDLLGVEIAGNVTFSLLVGETSLRRWRIDLCDWHKETETEYRFLKLTFPYECKFIDSPVSFKKTSDYGFRSLCKSLTRK
jgi:hypothetical protein